MEGGDPNASGSEPNKTLFGVFADGLGDFLNQVQGNPGNTIRAISKDQLETPIPQLIREVLELLVKAMRWLKDLIEKSEPHLKGADALIAALEVTEKSFEAMSGEFYFGNVPGQLGLPEEPFHIADEVITNTNNYMGQGIKYGLTIAHLLPFPEELAMAREILDDLLRESKEESDRKKSLVELYKDIGGLVE